MDAEGKGGPKILITGLPGVGKTTLLIKVAHAISEQCPTGFYTEEIRERGARVGFRAMSLGGRSRMLSHVDFPGPHRVGRYGVDIKGFELFLKSIDLPNPKSSVVVIDEIGKMECLSSDFKNVILSLFESSRTILATISKKGDGLIRSLKSRSDSVLFEVTPRNRKRVFSEVVGRIREEYGRKL